MKKYIKPDLCYEDFELSTHVAGGCVDSLNHTEAACRVDLDKIGLAGQTLFTSVCDIDYYEAGTEIYCEFSGADAGLISLFTS